MKKLFLMILLILTGLTLLVCDMEQTPDNSLLNTGGEKQAIALNTGDTWIVRALEQQSHLGMFEPLSESDFLIATHNSFNSSAYRTAALNYGDPNHTLSLAEMLDIGVRGFELDVHYYNGKLLLCHSSVGPHAGCHVADRPFRDGINEINSWLRRPENRHVLIYIYIQDVMDGRYDMALSDMDPAKDLIYRPRHCGESFPGDVSKAQILSQGKQIIFGGGGAASCSSGDGSQVAFANLVFSGVYMGSVTGSFRDGNYEGYPVCRYGSTNADYLETHLQRVYEDRTNFAGLIYGDDHRINDYEIKDLVDCAVKSLNFDKITPNDNRLPLAVWSWSKNEPNDYNNDEDCAEMRWDGKMNDNYCGNTQSFACQNKSTKEWKITSGQGSWQDGDTLCTAEFGSSFTFSVPRNGYQMRKLQEKAAGISRIWLNYSDTEEEGFWIPGDRDHDLDLSIEPQAPVYRPLKNDYGKCLDLEGRNTSSGTDVHQWKCHHASSQYWYHAPDGTLRPLTAPNMCIDAWGGGTSKGTKLKLYACHGGENQVWLRGPNNTFLLKKDATKAFDIKDPWLGDGKDAHLWDYHGGRSQRWKWDE